MAQLEETLMPEFKFRGKTRGSNNKPYSQRTPEVLFPKKFTGGGWTEQ